MLTALITGPEIHARATDDDEGHKSPRFYFWMKGTSVIDNLMNRGSEPHDLVRPLVPEVMKQFGVEVNEATLHWSRKAGCDMCPCSPGFYMRGAKHPEYGNQFDVHVQVEIVERVHPCA